MAAERHSKAATPEQVTDPDEKARLEARNGLLQADLVDRMIDEALDAARPFKLRPSRILALQREAIQGLDPYAGNFRPADIAIEGSEHQPPGAHLVPELIEDMCDYVNDNWEKSSPVHLAAYCMWRLNWIHPFTDGNGRTSRAVSHLVLCAKLGMKLAGGKGIQSIPEQITNDKDPYYDALEQADKGFDAGKIDVSAMEELLAGMLAKQLYQVHQEATK